MSFARFGRRQTVRNRFEKGAKYLPTPEEIERATREVRDTWSAKTYRSRSGRYPMTSAVVEMPSMPRRKGFEMEF